MGKIKLLVLAVIISLLYTSCGGGSDSGGLTFPDGNQEKVSVDPVDLSYVELGDICNDVIGVWQRESLLTYRNISQLRQESNFFRYDQADEVISANFISSPLIHDPGLAVTSDGLWVVWLDYSPGEGDYLQVGLWRDGQWLVRESPALSPGKYANPNITPAVDGGLWLSYEKSHDGEWGVWLSYRKSDGGYCTPKMISGVGELSINHAVTSSGPDAITMSWQVNSGGHSI